MVEGLLVEWLTSSSESSGKCDLEGGNQLFGEEFLELGVRVPHKCGRCGCWLLLSTCPMHATI